MDAVRSAPAFLQMLKVNFPYLLLVLVVAYFLRNKFRPVLWNIPGPAVAGWTSLWRLREVWNGKAQINAIEMHRKWGNLVRVGPNHVSVGDPDAIPIIYGLKSGFTKTGFYPIQSIVWQKKPRENIFSTRDEQYHRDLKRPIANAYSMTSLLDLEPGVDSCSKLFMSRLRDFAEPGKSVDLGAWLQFYAFDVIGEISFSKKLGFLDQGGDIDGMIETIGMLLIYATLVGQVPIWHIILLGNPIIPYLFPNLETWNAVTNFTVKAINSCSTLQKDGELESGEAIPGKDMLSRWLAVKTSSPEKMSTLDIVVSLTTNVFAGSDTTAIALRAIIYFLCRHPEKMTKLVNEIDSADKEGKLSDFISYKESTTHLPYMNAVMKEAMRLHPSVGLILERHVPRGGAEICGRHIPGGTIVGINAWVLHHNPRIFPDPDSFLPERWIEASPERLREMEQSYFVFGAGSRTCVGKNISIMEITKVIPQILREFTVSLASPEKEWQTVNVWFVQQKGLIVNLEKRRKL